jgi:hypothetical protein
MNKQMERPCTVRLALGEYENDDSDAHCRDVQANESPIPPQEETGE